MATRKFFVGENLLGDIRRTITRVDEIPILKAGVAVSRSGDSQSREGQLIRVGEFTGTWNKGDLKTVTWTPGGTIAATVEAKNLFWDVGEAGTATSSCAIGRVGSTWYLIAAEQEFGFHMGEFNGSWSKGATKTVNILRTGEQVTALNKLVSLSPTSSNFTTTVAIAKDGTAWNLVSFEMATATAVFVAQTTTSQVISSISISAVLNTSDCSITVSSTPTTALISVVSQTAAGNYLKLIY